MLMDESLIIPGDRSFLSEMHKYASWRLLPLESHRKDLGLFTFFAVQGPRLLGGRVRWIVGQVECALLAKVTCPCRVRFPGCYLGDLNLITIERAA